MDLINIKLQFISYFLWSHWHKIYYSNTNNVAQEFQFKRGYLPIPEPARQPRNINNLQNLFDALNLYILQGLRCKTCNQEEHKLNARVKRESHEFRNLLMNRFEKLHLPHLVWKPISRVSRSRAKSRGR